MRKGYRIKFRRTQKIKLLGFMLMLFQAHAMDIEDSLNLKPEDIDLWQAHAEHLTAVEHRMHTNLVIKPDKLRQLRRNFEAPLHIHNINVNTHQNLKNFAPDDLERFNTLTRQYETLIQALPKFQCTSYKGMYLSPEYWQEIKEGDLFFEKGFFHSQGTVVPIIENLKNNELMNQIYHPVMIKVDSETGRFFNFAYQKQRGDMLMPRNSGFQIVKKGYASNQDLYYLHIKQVFKKKIREIKNKKGFVDFSGVRHKLEPSCSS